MSWRGSRVLVTGATGFVGGRLAARLAEQGAAVTALARRPSAVADTLAAEVVTGDLADAGAIARACRGAEVVFHCAARPADSGASADFYRDNVEGTLRLARAAADAGCARFVFLSSISVYGFEPPPRVDERTPVTVDRIGGSYPYAESKIVAERALAAFGGRMEITTVRVGSVYGPGSFHWTERPVRVMRNPAVGMIYVDGGRGLHNYVYIDNLVDGLLLTGSHAAAAGGLFNLTDGCATYRDFFECYARMLGGRGRTRTVSRGQALALAYAMERLAQRRGRTPMITRIAVRLLLRRAEISSAHARDTLGYQPRVSLTEGMAACQRWLGDSGLL